MNFHSPIHFSLEAAGCVGGLGLSKEEVGGLSVVMVGVVMGGLGVAMAGCR